ncbi:hypothetical protein MMPV_002127 [Pyropia vietnamensis]
MGDREPPSLTQPSPVSVAEAAVFATPTLRRTKPAVHTPPLPAALSTQQPLAAVPVTAEEPVVHDDADGDTTAATRPAEKLPQAVSADAAVGGAAKPPKKVVAIKAAPTHIIPSVPFPDQDAEYETSESEDAEDYKKGGYHVVRIGETFKNGRYRVLQKLGWGHFSTVWLCLDIEMSRYCAVKVQKSAPHYAEAAKDEIRLLNDLRANLPSVTGFEVPGAQAAPPVVELLDSFEHEGPNGRHVCLAFELLGKSLLSLVKRFNYRGVPIPLIKVIARQILEGLDYSHSVCGIIHTDIKPENVLFVPHPSEIMDLQARTSAALAEEEAATASKRARRRRRRPPVKARGESHGTSSGLTTPRSPSSSSSPTDAAATDGRGGATFSGDCGGPGAETVRFLDRRDGPGSPHGAKSAATSQSGSNAGRQSDIDSDGDGNSDCADETDCASPAEDTEDAREAAVAAAARFSALYNPNPDLAFASGCIKVVDFGNACWVDKHFTEDIQTRQYRAPEVILGASYDTSADIWSVATLLFELATGDFLFDPHSDKDYDRDEDHLALMMELLGPLPPSLIEKGQYSREFFTRSGELRHIRRLNFWSLRDVLGEKYKLPPEDAVGLSQFLAPMLIFDPAQRSTAAEALLHPFVNDESTVAGASGHWASPLEHDRLRNGTGERLPSMPPQVMSRVRILPDADPAPQAPTPGTASTVGAAVGTG